MQALAAADTTSVTRPPVTTAHTHTKAHASGQIDLTFMIYYTGSGL